MYKGFSCRVGEGGAEAGDVFEVEVGCFSDLLYMVGEGEVAVKENAKVATVGGGGEDGVVDGEMKVCDCGGEGVWANDDEICFVIIELEKIAVHPVFDVREAV